MKKTTLGLFALALMGVFHFTANAVPLTIEVQNVKTTSGPIHIGLFNSEAAWDSALRPTATSVLLITAVKIGTSEAQFDVPPGDYAFVLFDDLNDDGVLETDAVGFPAEPYALSQNYQLGLSKPSWDDFKFTVGASGATQNVTLIDP